MGSSMMKTTLREIRQSLGRYLAIMAIVALGVGLFCGLKVTRDVMVKSAQQYFEERQLYDISLLSTVGFDTDVAKQLSRRERCWMHREPFPPMPSCWMRRAKNLH